MTYREMLGLLRSKGVRVDEDRNGFKADGEEGLMKFWMVRVKGEDDDMFMFCCGFDMLGNGRLVISHKDYPIDENIFESLQDAIKRNEGEEYPADQILLMPDLDYYDSSNAPREDDAEGHFGYCDVVMTSNDDADIYTFTALCNDNRVLSGRVYKDEDRDEVRLHGDIRQHWDMKQPEEKGRTDVYERKKFYENAREIIERCVCEMCEQMGYNVMRFFNI